MGFSKMLELLQIKEKGNVVLCGLGSFYLARGKDALLLHKIANLKLNCMEIEVCKIGFPIASLEKYTDLLEVNGYSYKAYFYNKQQKELELVKQYKGKKTNQEKQQKANCYLCKNTVKYDKKTDEYIEALAKLYEKEKIEKLEGEEKKQTC
ncbi:MAG: hypothetical protein HFJ33_05755 [Clostridia bacterium]|nr:hypothetical protein [Clostridia bacterium]